MKILHIAPIGHHAEGIGSVLKDLVPYQRKLNNDVRIISLRQNKVYENLDIVTIIRKKDFIEYLSHWHPDFVLFHSVYKKPYLFMYKELVKREIPYGIQMHGGLSKENYRKGYLKKIVANYLFYNSFFKHAKSIFYLSESEYERCIVKRINDRSTFIPNGTTKKIVDISSCLPNSPLEIIFVGRISMYVKGLDKLIEAIGFLDKNVGCHFSIYGNEDDVDTPVLKKLIVDKCDFVDYKGGLYGVNKDKVMRNANIFILTSPSEGMPMGVLEALSYGMPCIVTPGTNMADVIMKANAGWVTDYDAREIAFVIRKAAKDYREKQEMYRENAYKLSSYYSWNNVADISLREYKKLIDHE